MDLSWPIAWSSLVRVWSFLIRDPCNCPELQSPVGGSRKECGWVEVLGDVRRREQRRTLVPPKSRWNTESWTPAGNTLASLAETSRTDLIQTPSSQEVYICATLCSFLIWTSLYSMQLAGMEWHHPPTGEGLAVQKGWMVYAVDKAEPGFDLRFFWFYVQILCLYGLPCYHACFCTCAFIHAQLVKGKWCWDKEKTVLVHTHFILSKETWNDECRN